MSTRETDAACTIAAIAGIAIIVVFCICNGIDDTIVKLGLAAIAGLAGFSLANLVRKQ
jgi:hypothetical protein